MVLLGMLSLFVWLCQPARAMNWRQVYGKQEVTIKQKMSILGSTIVGGGIHNSRQDSVLSSEDSGATWEIQYPNKTTEAAGAINALEILNADTWVGVSTAGRIYKTANRGKDYTQINAGTTEDLTDVSFGSDSVGWAVGAHGVALKSADGGSTWTLGNIGVDERLNAVDAVDANTVVVTGNGGIAKRSVDGGQTWTDLNLFDANTEDGAEVTFVGAKGWLSTYSGSLYVSTDSGATWTEKETGVNDGIGFMHFIDADHGAAAIWKQVGSCTPSAFGVICATNITYSHSVLITDDGGTTWTRSEVNFINPNSINTSSFTYANVLRLSADNLVTFNISNANAQQGIFSSDKGATWTTPNGGLMDIVVSAMAARGDVIWLGGNGQISVSTDNGEHWTVNPITNTPGVNRISILDAATAVLATNHGIYKLVDSGANGTLKSDDLFFQSVSFVDGTTGWAAGDQGRIQKTTDGGETWTTQAVGLTTNMLFDIQFFDANHGWAVGNGGTTLYTEDGGTTWLAGTGASGLVRMVIPFSATRVISFVGSTLWTSEDGGRTWTSRTGADLPKTPVRFLKIGANDVVVNGEGGLLWRTRDAGATWTTIGRAPVNGQAFFTIGRIVGATGSIFVGNGNIGVWVSEIETTVDSTPPQPGGVSDEGAFTGRAGSLSASWSGFTDDIGVTAYDYSIGTVAGGTTIRDWTSAGAAATVVATGLSLSSGTAYFVNVRARDGGGNTSTVASSDGITVDLAAPVGLTVSDEGAFTGSTTQLAASWPGVTDALSGVGSYSYSIGTSAGADDVKGWTSAGANTQATATGLSLGPDATYFFNVRAVDNVGNVGDVASSDGIQYIADAEPPTAGQVLDEGAFTRKYNQLSASWAGFLDDTGIAEYSYSIGTSAGDASVKGWTSVGADTHVVVTGLLLSYGINCFFNVRAKDAAGHLSATVSSDGIEARPLLGDVDVDGDVDFADAVLANRMAAGLETWTPLQLFFGDLAEPKDGTFTTEDANLILRCAKGTIKGKPEYPWCPVPDGRVSKGGAP